MGKDDAQIIIEYFDDKFAILLDNLESIIDRKTRAIVQEELEPIKSDMKVVKAAVTETNRDVHDLQQRVANLEAA